MNSAVIACNTVADELKLAIKETGASILYFLSIKAIIQPTPPLDK